MDINQSLHKILQSKDDLARMFYEHFLEKHPEVRHFFAKVDLGRQRILLTTSLMVIERFHANATPAVEQYLQYLGTKHHEMAIPRGAYDKWTVAMLETMQEFHGNDWSPELSDQWKAAIEQAKELMLQGYDERVTV
jgi:hemoglobin-like flavoprotein